MALRGTLADLGPVDLVQYPLKGRQTGELVVTSQGEKCCLYYENGQLVHLTLGRDAGMAALVEFLGWTEGNFEFNRGSRTKEVSLELDLHHAVMEALRVRDERASANEEPSPAAPTVEELRRRLERGLNGNSTILRTCLLDNNGENLAESGDGDPLDSQLLAVIHRLFAKHPRPGLRRFFFEDEDGIVVVQGLATGGCLVVASGDDATAGSASVQAGRLAQAVGGSAE